MKIPIGISKRHIHLTEEVFNKLFGSSDITVRNYLNQPGEFASNYTADLKWNDKVIERVRIIGPFRNYNQIEITRSDAELLGIKAPVRRSGDIEGTHPITLVGTNGEVNLEKGLLIAERHIHIDSKSSKELNLNDSDKVLIYKDGKELYDAFIKVGNSSFLELHIDYDEALKYDLKQDDEVEVYKL